MEKITANKIIQLLAARHSGDVFVPECKNGPTQTAGAQMVRMDAWTMKKAWSRPLVTGYEVKISRNDFMRDDKWHRYLDYCNEFYFVCPSGLIMPDELPPEVGLIYTSKNCAKLFTKKKAVWRDVVIPENVFRYVLMARTEIKNEYNPQNRLEYWQKWLADKKFKKDLGYAVSSRVNETVKQVNRENLKLKNQNNLLEDLKSRITEMGLDCKRPISSWDVDRKLDEVMGGLPPGFSDNLQTMISHMQRLQKVVGREK